MKQEITHAEMVQKLVKPGHVIYTDLNATRCDLLHATIGAAGEVGEIVDTIKKHCIYNQPLDINNLREELGDLEFYLEQLRQVISITREECLTHNMTKLSLRYPGFNYSDTRAKERADKC